VTETTGKGTGVQVRHQGAVLLLTLDGPESRNAIGPEVYRRIQACIIEAGRDPAVRAVVLTGAGGFFSSGGNVNALRDSARLSLAEVTGNTDGLNAMIKAVVDSPTPVIAAIEGGAAGAGLSLALACDLIVAAEQARFTVAHVRVGLSPDGGATHFLRAALPRQLVMELCLLGQPVTAERLAQAGVVNSVVPAGEALAAAMAMAERVAQGPPRAIGTIKGLVDGAPSHDLATHLDLEARAINLARFGAEAAEGLAAFLEKRRPAFGAAADTESPPAGALQRGTSWQAG